MGYNEGVLIGELKVISGMVSTGFLSVKDAAKGCDMTPLEYMMKLGYKFEDVDKILKEND